MSVEMLDHVKIMESYAFAAPVLFILVHILRPLLILPVLLLCITGGILFGMLAGTVYSIIGLMMSSFIFYYIMHLVPAVQKRCERLELKLLGEKGQLTTMQIVLLRMLPFIHFHLLSFCIYQKSVDFKQYVRTTFFSVVPLAIFYTTLGKTIQEISLLYAIPFVVLILLAAYYARKKQIIIKWQTFFSSRPT
ncbi:VTT domain-containing protein [Gracilibacillus sp. YIM 98692]|uniref:TVP38/TMEM64 family protein n=1 Tax=Gracilibacillus sp. YIM 98692 TaxID=2663532 RepID=UPI001F09C3AA|nr:VTT domain-containing protein [Gracilibacillus sp. YIM 98692]